MKTNTLQHSPIKTGEIFLKRLIFRFLLVFFVVFFGVLFLPFLARRSWTQRSLRVFCRFIVSLFTTITDVHVHVDGKENVNSSSRVIACKHQSAFEAFFLPILFPDIVMIVKKELFQIPIFGWYLKRSGAIALPRSEGRKSVKLLQESIKKILESNSSTRIGIFPEGTRVPYGKRGHYKKGVQLIYGSLKSSIIPIALNSGKYWSKKGLNETHGTIVVKILPPIPKGLSGKKVMEALENSIEDGCEEIESMNIMTKHGQFEFQKNTME